MVVAAWNYYKCLDSWMKNSVTNCITYANLYLNL